MMQRRRSARSKGLAFVTQNRLTAQEMYEFASFIPSQTKYSNLLESLGFDYYQYEIDLENLRYEPVLEALIHEGKEEYIPNLFGGLMSISDASFLSSDRWFLETITRFSSYIFYDAEYYDEVNETFLTDECASFIEYLMEGNSARLKLMLQWYKSPECNQNLNPSSRALVAPLQSEEFYQSPCIIENNYKLLYKFFNKNKKRLKIHIKHIFIFDTPAQNREIYKDIINSLNKMTRRDEDIEYIDCVKRLLKFVKSISVKN